MKKLIFCFFLFISTDSFAQETPELKVYSFEEVETLQKENPKPIVVFIHAKWCGYCHQMRGTVFIDPKIINILNESFYFISFDGEYRKDITFLGKTYAFKPYGNSGTHELALKLATKKRRRMAYPTTVILNSEFKVKKRFVGFINKRKVTSVLKRAKKL